MDEFLTGERDGKPVVGFTRFQLTLLVAGVMILSVLGATFGANAVTDRVSKDEFREDVGTALVNYCEANLEFRQQQRQRTEADDLSTKLQVSANEALINVVNEIELSGSDLETISVLGHKLDRVNAQLNDVRAESAAILPLPECAGFRNLLG